MVTDAEMRTHHEPSINLRLAVEPGGGPGGAAPEFGPQRVLGSTPSFLFGEVLSSTIQRSWRASTAIEGWNRRNVQQAEASRRELRVYTKLPRLPEDRSVELANCVLDMEGVGERRMEAPFRISMNRASA